MPKGCIGIASNLLEPLKNVSFLGKGNGEGLEVLGIEGLQ